MSQSEKQLKLEAAFEASRASAVLFLAAENRKSRIAYGMDLCRKTNAIYSALRELGIGTKAPAPKPKSHPKQESMAQRRIRTS